MKYYSTFFLLTFCTSLFLSTIYVKSLFSLLYSYTVCIGTSKYIGTLRIFEMLLVCYNQCNYKLVCTRIQKNFINVTANLCARAYREISYLMIQVKCNPVDDFENFFLIAIFFKWKRSNLWWAVGSIPILITPITYL